MLIQFNHVGLDQERSPVRHGIAGIYRQVQDDLLELSRVSPDPWQSGVQLRKQNDILTHQPAHHGVHAADHVIQLEHYRLKKLPPAESQQLASKCGGAVGGILNFEDISPPGIVRRKIAQQELGLGADDRQHIVEVVGHTAGEAPYGFHFMGLPELLLQLLSLGDVRGNPQHLAGAAIGGQERHLHCLEPSGGPGGRTGCRFFIYERGALRGNDLAIVSEEPVGFLLLQAEIRVASAEDMLDGSPVKLRERAIRQDVTAFPILHEDQVGIGIDDLPEEVLVVDGRCLKSGGPGGVPAAQEEAGNSDAAQA
jgi:hypothetical protein